MYIGDLEGIEAVCDTLRWIEKDGETISCFEIGEEPGQRIEIILDMAEDGFAIIDKRRAGSGMRRNGIRSFPLKTVCQRDRRKCQQKQKPKKIRIEIYSLAQFFLSTLFTNEYTGGV
jgi:hypothetical protein